jgi:hypothetical protein
VTASLLLLASLLGTGHVPAEPVPTPIAVGPRYQLPATTAATRRARHPSLPAGRMNSQTGVLLASLLALGAGVAAVVIVLLFGQAVV